MSVHVVEVAVHAQTAETALALARALVGQRGNDGAFDFRAGPHPHSFVLMGTGEPHLEHLAEHLARDFGHAVTIDPPSVAYRGSSASPQDAVFSLRPLITISWSPPVASTPNTPAPPSVCGAPRVCID